MSFQLQGRYSLLYILLAIGVANPYPAFATDDGHHHTPPKVIVVERRDHDALVGALIGAGITYWLVQRHKRRQERPLVIIQPQSEECSATVERVLESCGVTK